MSSSKPDKLGDRIQRLVCDPEATDTPALTAALRMLARVYATGVRLRSSAYRQGMLRQRRLPCKVVSVGNIVVGGSGKTPMAAYLAQLVTRLGFRPAVVSRGYKGRRRQSAPMVVHDGKQLLQTAAMAGDEAYMLGALLKTVPVIVAKQRYLAGQLAVSQFAAQVVILDDGFQHLALHRDLDIVMLDPEHPLGNGHLLPRGPMREPAAALKRADALVIKSAAVNPNDPAKLPSDLTAAVQRPLFHANYLPVVETVSTTQNGRRAARPIERPEDLNGLRGFAFAGIAHNDQFFATLRQLGMYLVDSRSFSDHHAYTRNDIEQLVNACQRKGEIDLMITTHKDFVRLQHHRSWPCDLVVLDLRVGFADTRFDDFIAHHLH